MIYLIDLILGREVERNGKDNMFKEIAESSIFYVNDGFAVSHDEYEIEDNDKSYVTADSAIRKRWKKLIYEKDKYYEDYIVAADRFAELIMDHLNGLIDLDDQELYIGLLRASGISSNAEKYLTVEDVMQRIDFKHWFDDQEEKQIIVKEMRDMFLMGSGENMTGRMKNVSGLLGEQELLDCFF